MRSTVILKALLLLACATGPLFTEDLPIAILHTARAMHINRDLLKTLPFYTCLETISRSRSASGRQKAKRADVVQVDVGVGADREIYSWPGQSTFPPGDISGLVSHGFLFTGVFESFAANLFVSGHGMAKLAGEEPLHGRQALHFTYTVPSLENRWVIDWYGARGLLGEEGDFWVDKTDYKLLRMKVRANTIPPNVPLKAVNIIIDYQLLSVNGRPALLPKQAQVIAVESSGAVLQDDEAFSHCHVFGAESRLATSEDLNKVVTQYESNRGILPPGLTLRIRLQSPVHADHARVGDAVEAALDSALKISTETIAPKDSIARGHVREFTKLEDPPDTWAVGLEFDELDWPGHSYAFLAEITGMQRLAGFSNKIYHRFSSTSDPMIGSSYSGTRENFWSTEIPGSATFFLQNNRELPVGFQMTWRTKMRTHP